MQQDREHPLYYLDAETLLVATYIWVDDELTALQAQDFKLPPKAKAPEGYPGRAPNPRHPGRHGTGRQAQQGPGPIFAALT